MAEPTDRQIEWAARVLCAAWLNEDPDDGIDEDGNRCPLWESYTKEARRFLAELERQHLKVTPDMQRKGMTIGEACDWEVLHARFPVCPDADQ